MVTCDKVQLYLKTFLRMHHVQTMEAVHCLKIWSQMTAPTSKLVPPKVEGLDTLSRHDNRMVEDEGDVS